MPENTTETPTPTTPTSDAALPAPNSEKSAGDTPEFTVPDAEEFVPTKWNREDETEADPTPAEDGESPAEGEPEPQKKAEEPAKPEGQLITVKVNGKEKNIPIEELVDRYQRGEGANEKFEQAAQIRKQAESVLVALKKNPLAVLRHPALGIEPAALRGMMEKALYEEIQYEQMTPEQREAVDNKRRLETIEAEKETLSQEKAARDKAELQRQYSEEYNKQIVQALEKSDLPKTAYTVKRMAYYMSQVLKAYNAKYKGNREAPPLRMPMEKIVELVSADRQKDLAEMTSSMDAEGLVSMLGKDTLKKLREHDVKILKSKGVGRTPAKQGEAQPKARKSKKVPMSQWKERNRKIMYGPD